MNFDEWFASFDAAGMMPIDVCRKAFNDATIIEREACAQECEEMERDMGYGIPQQCADAIRARNP